MRVLGDQPQCLLVEGSALLPSAIASQQAECIQSGRWPHGLHTFGRRKINSIKEHPLSRLKLVLRTHGLPGPLGAG